MRKRLFSAFMCVVCIGMSSSIVSAETVDTYSSNSYVQEAKDYLEDASEDDRYVNYSVGELAEKMEESDEWMDKLGGICKAVSEDKVRSAGLDPEDLPLAADIVPYLNVSNGLADEQTASVQKFNPVAAVSALSLDTQETMQESMIQRGFVGTATPYEQEDSSEKTVMHTP